jgi:hypothetical protein
MGHLEVWHAFQQSVQSYFRFDSCQLRAQAEVCTTTE